MSITAVPVNFAGPQDEKKIADHELMVRVIANALSFTKMENTGSVLTATVLTSITVATATSVWRQPPREVRLGLLRGNKTAGMATWSLNAGEKEQSTTSLHQITGSRGHQKSLPIFVATTSES
jgi:hypothetical protein